MLREIVRFAVPGCALAAAIWMLARYFAVLRPRAGTTEWIGRLTPPPWQPVSGCPLHGMDAPAALLLCLAVTGLRLLEHWLRFHALPVTPEALLPVLFAGLAAGCAHLLLRRLLGGMLPALSGALLFGLLQDGSLAVTAALLGYVLWRTAKRCGGGWIVLSVICFAAGLLKERALLLLLPLYPIGYVCTRLSRRTGLGRSLALTLPLSLLGALGVAVLGWWMAGRGTPLEALRSFRFYEALWPALCEATGASKRRCFEHSFCLSADVSNAFDPLYAETCDPTNNTKINYGTGIFKYTGARGKSGSSDAAAEVMGYVRRIFAKHDVIWQTGELGKVDQGGGGTVACYMANRNIETVDAGVPVLSMHAPMEIVSKLDTYMTFKGMKVFYEEN